MKFDHHLKTLFVSLIIVGLFTAIDALFHIVIPGFNVSTQYFVNKVLFGTILTFIALLIVQAFPRNTKSVYKWYKSLSIAITVSSLLQLRYLFAFNYSAAWNWTVLIVHVIILETILLIYYLWFDND